MRRFLPLLVLVAAGCYSPRAIGTPAAYDGGFADPFAPLEATLYFNEYTSTAFFDVNRPAHVAIFAFRPGGTSRLLYPSVGRVSTREFSPGQHTVSARGGSHYGFASGWSTAYGASPTYIILIAAEQQLNVQSFATMQRVSYSFRQAYHSSPYMAVEALADEVVPNSAGENWTYAMQVVWPQNAWPNQSQSMWYVNVACANGVILTVPAEAYRRGWVRCPNSEAEPTEPTDSVGAEGGIREALPNRPAVPGRGGSSTIAGNGERVGVRGGLPARPGVPVPHGALPTDEGTKATPERPTGPEDGEEGTIRSVVDGILERPAPPGWTGRGWSSPVEGEQPEFGRVIRGVRSAMPGIDRDAGAGVISVPIRDTDWRRQLWQQRPDHSAAARPGHSAVSPRRPLYRPRSPGADRPRVRPRPTSSKPEARPAPKPVPVKPAPRPAPRPKPSPPPRPKPKRPTGGG